MTKKPTFTKFFGDKERAKQLLPKSRDRQKHLYDLNGPFVAGVRVDRSVWDGVEIEVHEYQDFYITRIYAPLPEGEVEIKGGVWLIPVSDASLISGEGAGGYNGLGDSIDELYLLDEFTNVLRYNNLGSWSHKTLEPKAASRGVMGPNDYTLGMITGPFDPVQGEGVEERHAFFHYWNYGVGRRGSEYTYHAETESYLSWDVAPIDVRSVGYTANDVEAGQAMSHTSRYFCNHNGTSLYWNGRLIGYAPQDTAIGRRSIVGAGLIGGWTGLKILLVCHEFEEAVNGTYLEGANNYRKPFLTVWKRSFNPKEPNGVFLDSSELGWENPETLETNLTGWEKIGQLIEENIPLDWRFHTRQAVNNYHNVGEETRIYWAGYFNFEGVACFNEIPKRDPDTNEILYYEFSGRLVYNSHLEYEVGEPAREPFHSVPNEEIEWDKWIIGGTLATAAFYTIRIDPKELLVNVIDWEEASQSPYSRVTAHGFYDCGFDVWMRGIDQGGGWVKAAVDYKDGEKVYLEGRTFIPTDLYTNAASFGGFKAAAPYTQVRWCGHAFNSSFHDYWYQAGVQDESDDIYIYHGDYYELAILGLDMRRDVAWLCSYFVEKRSIVGQPYGNGLDYILGYGTGAQRASYFLVRGETITHMYDEFDGPEPLRAYNLASGSIAEPSVPSYGLRNSVGSQLEAGNPTYLPYWLLPMGKNLMHIGLDGSYREKQNIIAQGGTRYNPPFDASRLQNSVVGFGVCHNGDTICGKVESIYGYAGHGVGGEPFPPYGNGTGWYITGVKMLHRDPAAHRKVILWDTLNGLNSYTETFNMPTNDSDTLWIGVMG